MIDTTTILAQVIADLEADVIASLRDANRIASGNTIAEFQTIVTPVLAQLIVPAYVDALEQGRAPTTPGAAAGDPTLFEAIQAWCQARGIPAEAAYPITKKIHEQGYQGTPGVITTPIGEDNVNMRLAQGMAQLGDLFGQEVASIFDVLEAA